MRLNQLFLPARVDLQPFLAMVQPGIKRPAAGLTLLLRMNVFTTQMFRFCYVLCMERTGVARAAGSLEEKPLQCFAFVQGKLCEPSEISMLTLCHMIRNHMSAIGQRGKIVQRKELEQP